MEKIPLLRYQPENWNVSLFVTFLSISDNIMHYYPTEHGRVQISRGICTRLIPPTARKIKYIGKSEFWEKENERGR